MSIESAKAYLAAWGKDKDVLEFSVSSATVGLAAMALHTEGARIAKTLSFARGEGCLLLVAAGDARIDNKRFKTEFGMKARMLDAATTRVFTGHAIGGVCPFGLPDGDIEVYADVSLKRFATVFPACGSANSAIELAPDELFAIAGCVRWVDVCSGWECRTIGSAGSAASE